MPDTTAPGQPHLIRHGELFHDTVRRFEPDAEQNPAAFPPDEPDWLVPLDTWLQRDEQAYRFRAHPVAVLLSPDSGLDALFAQQDAAALQSQILFLAIDFPAYTDGRGYSLAQLSRRQYNWKGELRAIGDVMIDTMHYMARCGFDSFLVKPSHDPRKALAALGTFSVQYQKSYPPVPRVAIQEA